MVKIVLLTVMTTINQEFIQDTTNMVTLTIDFSQCMRFSDSSTLRSVPKPGGTLHPSV